VSEALAINEASREDGHLMVVSLPELPSEERNWLLRHASVVLYPTSAEGFGLVPFEAARFGTPTVFVGFGPLAELGGNPPVLAQDWSPAAIADAVEALLNDPALAFRQVQACLEAASHHSWSRAADDLTLAYRTTLDLPPR
jgi:glycosyltransferase involved in cell wall biosynthesis